MTEPPSFYRKEALDHQTGTGPPGEVLQVAPKWTRWLYWIVLCLLVAAVAAAFQVRVDRTVSGVAVIDPKGTSFTAVFPLDDPSAVPPGRRLRLEPAEFPRRGQLVGLAQHSEVLTTAAARQAGFGPLTEPAVLVTGELRVPASSVSTAIKARSRPGLEARAVVVVGSDRVADIFARSVQDMLGRGGSQ